MSFRTAYTRDRARTNGLSFWAGPCARTAIVLLSLLSFEWAGARESAQTSNRVQIDTGTLEGVVSDGVLVLKGIPFAAAPVGSLRWRSPQPAMAWTGVRQAKSFGHDCMQVPNPGDAAPPVTTPSEDCLFVNAWRPAVRRPGEKLPVLFWIHGGAYVNGGTSTPIFDGSAFARQGLVFISANYRLGRLGFFAHPALFDANEGPVGNFGYMDQIEALRWLQRNADALGADPEEVTIMGESAGGDSVMHLVTSPEARGLFHRAIAMSGDGRNHVMGAFNLRGGASQPSAERIGLAFALSVGITGTGADALKKLRALPAGELVRGLNMAALVQVSDPITYARGPIVDGRIVIDTPGEILRRGDAARVPVLIGTTSADLSGHKPVPRDDPLTFFGVREAEARAAYDPQGKVGALDIYLAIGADLTMHEPSRFVAKQVSNAGLPAWWYRFDYVAQSLRPEVDGATHFSEVPYLFQTLDSRYPGGVTEKDRAVARAFSAYFANFARSGDPNGAGLPRWQRYDPARADLMVLTRDQGPVMQPDPWKARLDVVERVTDGAAEADRR